MEGKELAELKNKVLEFMLPMGDDTMGVDLLYKRIPNPFDDPKELLEVLITMTEEAPNYFEFDQKNYPPIWFSSNGMTQRYLDKGGFVNQYESDREADMEALKLAAQDQRIKDSQEKKLKYWWVPIGVSLLGLGIAIASYFRPSDKVTQDQLSNNIEVIQDSIQSLKTDFQKETDALRNDFQKESDSLKDRLYKAEMLIAVYGEK